MSVIGNKNALGNRTKKPRIYTPDFIEKEADKLLHWAAQDSSLTLLTFTSSRGYAAQRLSEFASKSPVFSEALKIAKEFIAQRIIVGAFLKDLNANVVMKLLPLYDESYKLYLDEIRETNNDRQDDRFITLLETAKIRQEIEAPKRNTIELKSA